MGSIDTISRDTVRTKPSHKLYMPLASVPLWTVLWRRYCRWQSMCRSREALRHLSDQQLRDIGISREQALAEADRNKSWNRLWL